MPIAPQLLFKGGILNAWSKKMAVALDSAFFETLPPLEPAEKAEAEVAWLVYDLVPSADNSRLHLQRTKIVYTMFSEALQTITRPKVAPLYEKLTAELLADMADQPEKRRPPAGSNGSPAIFGSAKGLQFFATKIHLIA